jgi:hypothetical protein
MRDASLTILKFEKTCLKLDRKGWAGHSGAKGLPSYI